MPKPKRNGKRNSSSLDDSDSSNSSEKSEASDAPMSDSESDSVSLQNSDSDSPPKKTKKSSVMPAQAREVQKKQPAALKATVKKSAPKQNPTSCAAVVSSGSATASSVSVVGGMDISQGPPVTTDAAAKKLVMQYLTLQNRPYSLLQIHDNLHKRVPKPTLERILGLLCGPGGGAICKEYGKAKIYFVDQSTLCCDYTQEQLDELTCQNEDTKEQIDELGARYKSLQTQVAQLQAEPTDIDLPQALREARDRLAAKQERVAALSGDAPGSAADGKAMIIAVRKYNMLRTMWTQRRSQCMDALDLLCDAMGKKRKDLIAELCLETDEDAQQSIPPPLKEPQPPKK